MELKRTLAILILSWILASVLLPTTQTTANSPIESLITPKHPQTTGFDWIPANLSAASMKYDPSRPAVSVSVDRVISGASLDECSPDSACLPGATYSLTATSLITTEIKKLFALDGMQVDLAGSSVSINGDTLVIGAPQEVCYSGSACLPGAVFIFYRNQNGEWSEVQKITPFDGAADYQFGAAVAINGDTLVVGAFGAAVGGWIDQGAVYIYERNQGGVNAWGIVTKLIETGNGFNESFGYAVSISGDTIVAGAPNQNNSQGAAYVFDRNRGGPDNWGQVKELVPLGDGLRFGTSLSISGDVIVVGEPGAKVGENSSQGMAHVFYRDQGGADKWGRVKELTAADGAMSDVFGSSVSVSGDAIVVGAPYAGQVWGPRGAIAKGAAYIFYRDQGGADKWGQVQKLMASDASESEWFGNLGFSVSISEDTIIAGAPAEACGRSCQPGAAYLYCRNEGGANAWNEIAKLIASDGVAFDKLGNSVSANGDTVVAGAPYASIGDKTLQGAAYLYSGCQLPLVFIPGIAGTRLVDRADGNTELWPGLFVGQSPLSLFVDREKGEPSPTIGPFDVIRSAPIPFWWDHIAYGPLFDELTTRGGYRLYRVDGDLARQTEQGCDMTQRNNKPTLFLFAYDWRQSNVVTAQKLKEYLGCVRKFYPDTKVNVLAHSMGGLVARRYILDNLGMHNVNALITIGTPWLGAPKTPLTLETGDFVPHVTNKVIKYIIGSFTGAHELIPSKAWYELGGAPPIVERGYDLNGPYGLDTTGNAFEDYDYEMFIRVLDHRYGWDRKGNQQFKPGTASRDFHTPSQDDWRSERTDIRYHHIYGYQLHDRTIKQVKFSLQSKCSKAACMFQVVATPLFSGGDKTVPLLSAERVGNSQSYNAPNARLYPITNQNDGLVEHTALCRNPEVLGLVLKILRDPTTSAASTTQTTVERSSVQTVLPQVEPAHYLTIDGADSVVVSDTLGNNTALIEGSESWHGAVPGVDMYIVGDRAAMAILPTAQPFTVTFTTVAEPLRSELRTGTGITTTGLIRYLDLALPVGVPARLMITAQGMEPLRYDGDGEGVFETAITPTIEISGTTTLDLEPPQVTISVTTPQADTNDIALSATDDGVGVKQIFYSIDGVHVSLYTETFRMATCQAATVYAFADDHLLNRSSVVAKPLPCSTNVYLPIIER